MVVVDTQELARNSGEVMKIVVVSSNEALGEAFAEQKRAAFARRPSTESFDAEVVTRYRKVEGATDVAFISVEQFGADDAAHIANAVMLAEFGDRDGAIGQLEGCRGSHVTRAWVEARQRVDFITPPTDPPLSEEIRVAVSRRGAVLRRIFQNHKGGVAALTREKDDWTPGPGTLLAFHRHVAETGRLPINDFGVSRLALETKPYGAYARDVGWMGQLYARPALFLDYAWWVTLDVIGLFSADDVVRDGAEERISRVPSGLREWRQFQIQGHRHDTEDCIDADMAATAELEAIARGEA